MSWQDFLKQKATKQGLSIELQNTLLTALPDENKNPQNQNNIANNLNIGVDTVKARLKEIYTNFASIYPELSNSKGAGKLKTLHNCLRQSYFQLNKTSDFVEQDISYPKAFRSLIESRIKRFVGREFVFDAFSKFVEENNQGYFTVTGKPGMGKSAIACKYVSDNQVPCYFNISSNANNTPPQFLSSLREQLIRRYALSNAEDIDLMTLLEEVRDRLNDEQPLIILVDALDEVRQEQGPENILYLPKNLPNNVYFFLTRRPYSNDTEKRLFTEIDTPQFELDLRKETKHNQEDIRKCLDYFLKDDLVYKDKLQVWLAENDYQGDNFINIVQSKVIDNFMYLVCLMDALMKDEYKNFDLNKLPPKLEDYYILHWQRMGMTDVDNRFKVLVIYTIKEIQTPIPKEAIAEILGTDMDAVGTVLNSWYQYFKIEKIEEEVCYDFYHLSFRSYIESRQELEQDKPMFKEVNERIFQYLNMNNG